MGFLDAPVGTLIIPILDYIFLNNMLVLQCTRVRTSPYAQIFWEFRLTVNKEACQCTLPGFSHCTWERLNKPQTFLSTACLHWHPNLALWHDSFLTSQRNKPLFVLGLLIPLVKGEAGQTAGFRMPVVCLATFACSRCWLYRNLGTQSGNEIFLQFLISIIKWPVDSRGTNTNHKLRGGGRHCRVCCPTHCAM